MNKTIFVVGDSVSGIFHGTEFTGVIVAARNKRGYTWGYTDIVIDTGNRNMILMTTDQVGYESENTKITDYTPLPAVIPDNPDQPRLF